MGREVHPVIGHQGIVKREVEVSRGSRLIGETISRDGSVLILLRCLLDADLGGDGGEPRLGSVNQTSPFAPKAPPWSE